MKEIDTLTSSEGRHLLLDIFRELRYKKHLSNIACLIICWRICVFEREIYKLVNIDTVVLHPLGFFSGTALWMEEIVNRFYFSSVNSFVYFGAAVLLLIIGVRRFSDHVSENMIIFGIAFESLMLIFMFIVMLFSPNEENYNGQIKDNNEDNILNDVVLEIGEISRDFAAATLQLEKMNDILNTVIIQQNDLLNNMNKQIEINSAMIAPNPQLLDSMKDTSSSLIEFKNSIDMLNNITQQIKQEQIQLQVRKELENMFINKIT